MINEACTPTRGLLGDLLQDVASAFLLPILRTSLGLAPLSFAQSLTQGPYFRAGFLTPFLEPLPCLPAGISVFSSI